ncbi:hypothetical protein AUC69_04330 [Methyloceanibacter superfactus]|uniref:Uncharacterized protein n=1 Tax=Methyloceanibacter superfactus TaxID=1774969 RepID=A0A1E3VIU0_9HYPH|nr:hypothetical protein AUC69_04330 [Methyloceanibacter superfactus]
MMQRARDETGRFEAMFKCQLREVYCWEKGSSFAPFINETESIEFGDLNSLAKGENCKYIQNGPYRIKICIDSPNGGTKGATLRAGENTVDVVSFDGHGEVFMFMPVERVNVTDGKVLGSAEGCFKIRW